MVTDNTHNMKTKYIKPAAEELDWLLETAILDSSIEGDLSGYGDENELTW